MIVLLNILFLTLPTLFSMRVNSSQIKNDLATNASQWEVDFFDDFEHFDTNNWQDQRIWVNNEAQCYVPNNKFNTRELSHGTLKLKVVNTGEKQVCDNWDK